MPSKKDIVTVDLVRVTTKPQFIERVLAAIGAPEQLRTPNWDAFEEQVREADRVVRIRNLDQAASELQMGVQILEQNGLLAYA